MTFLSIVGVSIYKGITNSPITLAISYKYIAFPAGVLVLVVSLAFLMTLWVRRKMRAA
jgi:ABC-type Mn2+/Zn2+ transport system permease subunit